MLSLCFASSGYAGSLVGQSRLSTVSMNMEYAAALCAAQRTPIPVARSGSHHAQQIYR